MSGFNHLTSEQFASMRREQKAKRDIMDKIEPKAADKKRVGTLRKIEELKDRMALEREIKDMWL